MGDANNSYWPGVAPVGGHSLVHESVSRKKDCPAVGPKELPPFACKMQAYLLDPVGFFFCASDPLCLIFPPILGFSCILVADLPRGLFIRQLRI